MQGHAARNSFVANVIEGLEAALSLKHRHRLFDIALNTRQLQKLLRAVVPATFRLSAAFVQFLATLLIARSLGATDSSAFFFWTSLMMNISVVSTFGLDKIALQRTPQLPRASADLGTLIGHILVIVLIFSLFAGSLLFLYELFMGVDTQGWWGWSLVLPFGVLGIALCRVNGETLKGLARPNLSIVYRQLLAGSLFLLLLIVFWSNLSSQLAIVVYVVSFILASVLAFITIGMRDLKIRFEVPSFQAAVALLRAGLPICISSILLSVAFVVPLLVLERTAAPEDVSYLTTSYRLFILINLLVLAAYSLDLPALARAGANFDESRVRKLYLQMTKIGCILFLIPVTLMAVFPDKIMSLFGPNFALAGNVLLIFMCFSAASLILGPTQELLLMIDRKREIAYSAAVRALLAVVLSLLLIPEYGAAGAALSISIAMLFQKLTALLFYQQHLSRV